ncbi:exodeoxyribonuclease VII large subunit [Frigidibacter sp. MR17.14]|uniref:exodeoxyribonuclease VII large subunit n=1 Tax=Frigidibacter sp. MR17.14 TaxID=3126509 RepID=UPI003013093A
MSDLFEDDAPEASGNTAGNAHDYSVSEIAGAVKRVIEGEFGRVRVRGEVGRVSRPGSGHLYFALKDDRATLDAVAWKGQAAKLAVKPEEGIEVIATGRMTTFPGSSKYQLVVENLEVAGQGALMAMLEKRRVQLQAEGLFDPARKQPIPFLPEVIGVVTSPSGAVIRDILHRLRDRFPRKVLIWPVAVQGQACAPEVARAIAGFNALTPGGALPRPDLLIVARGGGSIEDLWGFNEEIVVRAAAASAIPLISAVGHETDTTLIDFAADLRAPTPTAAAEMAVPVRAELAALIAEQGARIARVVMLSADRRRQRLADLARALGRPEALTAPARQRLDLTGARLDPSLRGATAAKRAAFARVGARMGPALLTGFLLGERRSLADRAARLAPALATRTDRTRERFDALAARLERAHQARTGNALREIGHDRERLGQMAARLAAVLPVRIERARERLVALDRMRATLGYTETLARGYAVVRAGEALVTGAEAARTEPRLEIEFADGRVAVRPDEAPPAEPRAETSGPAKAAAAKPKKPAAPDQGSLF